MIDYPRPAWARSLSPVPLLTTLCMLAIACGDSTGPADPGDPGDPGGGPAASVAIEPGALLLTSAGETMQLEATAYDADGDPMQADISWRSTDPGAVSVSSDGVATAAAVGSAQIIATADGMESEPALALVARPAAGTVLVPDAQILSDPEAVDPDAEYEPGWRYRIQVRDVVVDAGQLVIGTGGRSLAGRVASASPQGSATQLTVELVPLNELFVDLSIDEEIPLVEADEETNGSNFLAPWNDPLGLGETAPKFTLGPFECETAATVPLITLSSPTLSINPSLALAFNYRNGLETYAVRGTIAADFQYKPIFQSVFSGKVECKAKVTTMTVPLGGPLALFVGIQVPIGIGLELGGKVEVSGVGFDVSAHAEATADLGLQCPAAGGDCTFLTGFDTKRDFNFEPIVPNLPEQFKVQLGGFGFLYATPSIGSRFSSQAQLEFLDVKTGLKQSVDLATPKRQVSEAGYASNFTLEFLFTVGPGSGTVLGQIGRLLGGDVIAPFNLIDLKDTLAVSPKGTFTITPPSVAPGDSSALGDMATFTIDLDPVTYLGLDAVESVEIFWKKDDGSGGFTLEPGRPGCTDITASSGQMQFTCQTDFLREHSGLQTFYAFVHAKMFGLTVPFALEVADDGSAIVTVASADCPASSGAFDIYSEASGQYGDGESEVVVAQFDHVHVTASADGGDAGSDGASWYAEATTADEIHLSPADTSRIGEFVTVDIHVRGEVSLSGTENPENGRAGAVAGFRYENERREWKLSEQNQGSIVIDETVTATAELGNWQFIGMSVIASLVPWPEDMYDASVQLRIVSVDNVRDLQGNPVPVTAFCAASGTDYNATAGSNIVIR